MIISDRANIVTNLKTVGLSVQKTVFGVVVCVKFELTREGATLVFTGVTQTKVAQTFP